MEDIIRGLEKLKNQKFLLNNVQTIEDQILKYIESLKPVKSISEFCDSHRCLNKYTRDYVDTFRSSNIYIIYKNNVYRCEYYYYSKRFEEIDCSIYLKDIGHSWGIPYFSEKYKNTKNVGITYIEQKTKQKNIITNNDIKKMQELYRQVFGCEMDININNAADDKLENIKILCNYCFNYNFCYKCYENKKINYLIKGENSCEHMHLENCLKCKSIICTIDLTNYKKINEILQKNMIVHRLLNSYCSDCISEFLIECLDVCNTCGKIYNKKLSYIPNGSLICQQCWYWNINDEHLLVGEYSTIIIKNEVLLEADIKFLKHLCTYTRKLGIIYKNKKDKNVLTHERKNDILFLFFTASNDVYNLIYSHLNQYIPVFKNLNIRKKIKIRNIM